MKATTMIGKLTPEKLEEVVEVTCYGKIESMKRKDCLNTYYGRMIGSQGAEHERYERIFFHALQGRMHCMDFLPI